MERWNSGMAVRSIEKIERELERLKRDGIIEPTQFSDWAAPVVPVTKADGSLRLCGDYKLTINKAAKLDSYPLPKIEDLFAKLAGGKRFTKLDVAHAYQQIPLSEESKPYVTITQGVVSIQSAPIWRSLCPSDFPTCHGKSTQGRSVNSGIP